ncbi:ABC transporter [Butyrivibrio sp. INlla18]|uniref:ATP-binding cassette domain-containing protein n=1 Tax=Butyrivibrio sp. INlla18 TaxID=1520806 RepID=UPI000888A197|nr:ABC transporter ATP-binding protein [Butyrivibrio sp. INlla18]SDA54725.1 ABC transporter [Butyrivibrio sp. INlla18]
MSKKRIEELFCYPIHKENDKKLRKIERLDCKNIEFKYENDGRVIKYEDIELKNASRIAIIGESGIGKSTLIRLLMREIEPKAGNIQINGFNYDSFNIKSYYDRIAVQEQEIVLYDDSVRNNILLGRNVPNDEFEKIITELGLNDCLEKMPEQLSGGEKKRVGLARALVGQHELLVLDEPTDGLDECMENKIVAFLDEYLRKHNMAMLVITHKMKITEICQKIIRVE